MQLSILFSKSAASHNYSASGGNKHFVSGNNLGVQSLCCHLHTFLNFLFSQTPLQHPRFFGQFKSTACDKIFCLVKITTTGF